MNIKGIVNNLLPIDFKKIDRKKTQGAAADRDPQQGGQGGGFEPQRHKFTDQEIEEVLKYLKEIPGIKSNNLQFRVERSDERVVIYVEEPSGKVIRRMADTELWTILKNKNSSEDNKGTLLNKAL